MSRAGLVLSLLSLSSFSSSSFSSSSAGRGQRLPSTHATSSSRRVFSASGLLSATRSICPSAESEVADCVLADFRGFSGAVGSFGIPGSEESVGVAIKAAASEPETVAAGISTAVRRQPERAGHDSCRMHLFRSEKISVSSSAHEKEGSGRVISLDGKRPSKQRLAI